MRKIREVALKLVKAIFRRFNKDELRTFAGEPMRERGADGASSAGDKNRLIDEGGDDIRRGRRKSGTREETVPINRIER